MRAKKENKVYRITTDAEKNRYLKDGFDIYDEDGHILEHSPKKKIAYAENAKLAEENAALKAEIESLKGDGTANGDADVIAILTAYALEHEVDLGKASTVSGIIKKINDSKAGE